MSAGEEREMSLWELQGVPCQGGRTRWVLASGLSYLSQAQPPESLQKRSWPWV